MNTGADPRLYTMSFARVYPLYIAKVERKGRNREEVNEILHWLTGYSQPQLNKLISSEVDFKSFFADAPKLNPNRKLITGVICGIRVEEITDPVTQNVRYLDKLIDELAKGKSMDKILRS